MLNGMSKDCSYTPLRMRSLIVVWLCFYSLASQSQDLQIADNVRFFRLDEIGNVYYVDNRNTVVKYEPNIKRYTKFADLKSGQVRALDVSNPLRILVHYGEQFVVRILDVNMTEINVFEIKRSYPNGWVRLVCSSNNNGLWMYDELNRKLIKVAEQLITQFETGDLYLVTSKKLSPNFMLEYGEELYLNDPKLGILVFDLFGGYKRLIPLPGITEFYLFRNEIYYQNDNRLIRYYNLKSDTILLQAEQQQVQMRGKLQYYIKDNKLFVH
jgi:hypothetical protein